MGPRVKARIVFPGGTKFGEGRARLLRLVAGEGSLRGAAKRMGMSYRAAWGYFRELEAAAGFPFLERAEAGPAGGTRLTRKARRFLAAFEEYHRRLQRSAATAFRASFGRGPARLGKKRRATGPVSRS